MTVDAASRDRIVITDDGERLFVSVYTADPPALATGEVEALQAIRVGRDLIDGGLRHLGRERR